MEELHIVVSCLDIQNIDITITGFREPLSRFIRPELCYNFPFFGTIVQNKDIIRVTIVIDPYDYMALLAFVIVQQVADDIPIGL